MSISTQKLIINKKSTTKKSSNKMIILEDTIKVLRGLVYEHNIEISGTLEVNNLNIVDIAGLLINGTDKESELPEGNIIFHTHPFEKNRKSDLPSDHDLLEVAYDYYKYKNIKNSLVVAPEGIYTCNLTNKFIKELDTIKDRKLKIEKLKKIYNDTYLKIRDISMIYMFKKKDSIKYYKSILQNIGADKKYYNSIIDLANKGISESYYHNQMKKFGYDIKLYKWNNKKMDIILLKNTKFTNNILTFQDQKEVNKFRKECSKQQLKNLIKKN